MCYPLSEVMQQRHLNVCKGVRKRARVLPCSMAKSEKQGRGRESGKPSLPHTDTTEFVFHHRLVRLLFRLFVRFCFYVCLFISVYLYVCSVCSVFGLFSVIFIRSYVFFVVSFVVIIVLFSLCVCKLVLFELLLRLVRYFPLSIYVVELEHPGILLLYAAPVFMVFLFFLQLNELMIIRISLWC